jgi:diadenosine tetraphosphate (Ap4A) HIT family hydrolase
MDQTVQNSSNEMSTTTTLSTLSTLSTSSNTQQMPVQQQHQLQMSVQQPPMHYFDGYYLSMAMPQMPPPIHIMRPMHQIPPRYEPPRYDPYIEVDYTNVYWNEDPSKFDVPDYLPDKGSIDLKLLKKKSRNDKRCYTCKLRGKVKNHVITTFNPDPENKDITGFIFHHDMHKRPIILLTPIRHVTSINELSTAEVEMMLKTIRDFTSFWNITDYQISYNIGKWQNHEHFHVKLRLPEKVINRMRRDHFLKLKLDHRY